MAPVTSRCAREARLLANRSSTLVLRPRTFHSAASLCADGTQPAPKPKNAPFRTTLSNQATFNAVKQVSDAPSFIRFTDNLGQNVESRIPGRGQQKTPQAIDVRQRGAPAAGAPRMVVRRPPPAPGASPRGNRSTGDHASDINATRKSGPPRSRQGGRPSPESARGMRGNRGTGSRGGGRGRGGAEVEVEEKKPTGSYTYEDFKRGVSMPADMDISDGELEYFAEKAEAEQLGAVYEPQLTEESLVGSGATTLTTSRDSAELMHRLLSRAAMPGAPTNQSWPRAKAQQLLLGNTVYFHSEQEARDVQEVFKYDPSLKADHIEFTTVPEADRAKVHDAWLAGKYVAPGAGAPKNASATVQSVWRQTVRNETYMVADEATFAKKVASMVPSVAARPAKGDVGKTPAKAAAKARQAAKA